MIIGILCYNSHNTQQTLWDSPRGLREQEQLKELKSFIMEEKAKLKVRMYTANSIYSIDTRSGLKKYQHYLLSFSISWGQVLVEIRRILSSMCRSLSPCPLNVLFL